MARCFVSGRTRPFDYQPHSPADVVSLHDAIRSLDGRDRRIAELLMQGCTQREIGPEIGLTHRAVCYRITKIREFFTQNSQKTAL